MLGGPLIKKNVRSQPCPTASTWISRGLAWILHVSMYIHVDITCIYLRMVSHESAQISRVSAPKSHAHVITRITYVTN